MIKNFNKHFSKSDDKKTLNQINSSKAKNLLLRKEYVPFLEDLIFETNKELILLEEEKKDRTPILKNKKYLSKKELRDLLINVSKDVDEFLEIEKTEKKILPRIGYNKLIDNSPLGQAFIASALALLIEYQSIYSSIINEKSAELIYYAGITGILGFSVAKFFEHKQEIPCCIAGLNYINVGDYINLEFDIKTVICHEYTHIITNPLHYSTFYDIVLNEGFARGVERGILKKSKGRGEDNFLMQHNINDWGLKDYYNAYMWMCEQMSISPKKDLKTIETKLHKEMPDLTPHNLGNTLFRIYEDMHGDNIYKKFLKRDIVFN